MVGLLVVHVGKESVQREEMLVIIRLMVVGDGWGISTKITLWLISFGWEGESGMRL